jgi:hypothetical protein
LKKPLQDLKETVFVARAESAAQNGLDIILTMVGQYIFEPENRMGIREQMIEETFGSREELKYRAGSQGHLVERMPA